MSFNDQDWELAEKAIKAALRSDDKHWNVLGALALQLYGLRADLSGEGYSLESVTLALGNIEERLKEIKAEVAP